MEQYTFVLPIKNTVLLSEGCLIAGEESKYVGSSVTSCEVAFDGGLQGGQHAIQGLKPNQIAHLSKNQLTKMRKALARARAGGHKDYSSETRAMIFKALD